MPPHHIVETGQVVGGWDFAHLALGILGWLLLLGCLAAVLVPLLLRRAGRPGPSLERGPPAEEQARLILAERFARGDMSSDEFLERCATLNWTPGAGPPVPRQRRGGR
jgi:uncharacterized membrane protein